jgi:two-component system nitrogen regulation sensor histidine kinase NtrY
MNPPDPIKTSDELKESRRRKREMLAGLFFFLLVIVLTFVQQVIGINSYLFQAVVNLNVILLVLVLFIVGRNGVKLLLERRRGTLGSKLRTRLVLAFISLSIVPTVVLFFISIKFVQTSADYWFKNQVGDTMEQALDLGRAFYGSAQSRLERRAALILDMVRARGLALENREMDAFLAQKLKEYDLDMIGLLSPAQEELAWSAGPRWEKTWPEVKAKIDWQSLAENPRWWSTIQPKPGDDLIVGLAPLGEGRGYLVLGESIGQGLMHNLDQLARGFSEYKKMVRNKSPWKLSLYLTLAVMTLLIILCAIWIGLRIAKELSSPIQALAEGAARVGKGDLSVRLEDSSHDELGFLVQSFNRMAEDLAASQEDVKAANEQLGRQNRELDEHGRYMAAVLNNITAGVISLDASGRVTTVNRAVEKMLALDGRRLVGQDPLTLLRGEHSQIMRDMLARLRSNPFSHWQRQLAIPVAGREATFLVTVVPLKNEEGRVDGYVAVVEDITELEKMQRLAAWREVARRIAHEIKNPLTPIKLSAQRLQRKFAAQVGDTVFDECTEMIVRQVESMQQMVTEFSAYAKLPEVVARPGFLAPLLEEVATLFRNSHPGIAWDVDIAPGLPEIRLDPEGLRRVFLNILTNAVEALEGLPGPAVRIAAALDPKAGAVRVEVRDNGPGLTPEERSRMFEPYFSSKKGGTGLGLTIVKSIVNDHQGFIRVLPNQPTGTVLVVELPVG